MGPNVMGIVLSHALPHLSHLALQAGQSAVPLVAVEDGALTEKIRSFEGKNVLLRSKPGDVKIEATDAPISGGASSTSADDPAASDPNVIHSYDFHRRGHVVRERPVILRETLGEHPRLAVSVLGPNLRLRKTRKTLDESQSSPFALMHPLAWRSHLVPWVQQRAGKT